MKKALKLTGITIAFALYIYGGIMLLNTLVNYFDLNL